jgi:hypothetical protein
VKDCTVSVRAGNGEIDTVAVKASSLFDAVEQAMRQWARLWWYRGDLVAEVRAGGRRWRGAPGRCATVAGRGAKEAWNARLAFVAVWHGCAVRTGCARDLA